MIGIDENKNMIEKTGILQTAGKFGHWIANKAISKAIPLATQLASKGGWLGKIGVSCSKILGLSSSLMAGPLGPIIGEIVGQLVIYAATNTIAHVAKKLNIISENDKAEEIGYRLEEASKHEDWKTREQFASFGDYYSYLCKQIPTEVIDRGKIQNDRLYFTAVGGDALRQGISDHYHSDLPIDMLIEVGRTKLDGDTFREILDKFSNNGYDLTKFKDYLQGKLKGTDRQQVEKAISDALVKVFPEYSQEQVQNKLSEMRKASREDSFLKDNVYSEEILTEQSPKTTTNFTK